MAAQVEEGLESIEELEQRRASLQKALAGGEH